MWLNINEDAKISVDNQQFVCVCVIDDTTKEQLSRRVHHSSYKKDVGSSEVWPSVTKDAITLWNENKQNKAGRAKDCEIRINIRVIQPTDWRAIAFTPNRTLRQKRIISHSFSVRTACDTAVTVVSASCNDFRSRHKPSGFCNKVGFGVTAASLFDRLNWWWHHDAW